MSSQPCESVRVGRVVLQPQTICQFQWLKTARVYFSLMLRTTAGWQGIQANGASSNDRGILAQEDFNCPWNGHVGNNSVKFSSETKAWDGQADNNKRQRRRWQQRRIHRQRKQRRWKYSLGDAGGQNCHGNLTRRKSGLTVKSSQKTTTNRWWLEFTIFKG